MLANNYDGWEDVLKEKDKIIIDFKHFVKNI